MKPRAPAPVWRRPGAASLMRGTPPAEAGFDGAGVGEVTHHGAWRFVTWNDPGAGSATFIGGCAHADLRASARLLSCASCSEDSRWNSRELCGSLKSLAVNSRLSPV